MAKHTLSVLVENHAGVLSRIAGLFSRRGFNIDSLAVGVTESPDVSRMTIVVDGDDYTIEQVSKQLNKLIDVIKIKLLDKEDSVNRELALVKVETSNENRAEIMQIVEIFRAKIVDVSHNSLTVEISGSSEKVNALRDLLTRFGIKEIVRTGMIAIERGNKCI
jgi:acetolactate synthase I/III small subunit